MVQRLEQRVLIRQWALPRTDLHALRKRPQIAGTLRRQTLSGLSRRRKSTNIPLSIPDRLVRIIRRTIQGALLGLLLGVVVCAPNARAQLGGSDLQTGRKSGNYTVSVRELKIPGKARDAFENGLDRLKKFDAAGGRTQFARAVAAFPEYYEAYYHLGVAELRLGNSQKAAEDFQKAIDLSSGRYSWAQFALGLVLCRRGEYAEAKRVIDKGLEVDSNSAVGHLMLSVVLFDLNRIEEAEQSAREALRRNPGLASADLALADVHERRQEFTSELHDLDAYLKLAPDGPDHKFVRHVREALQQMALTTKNRD